MANFTWENFDTEFINSVVYSPNTASEHKPAIENHEKDLLIASMNCICSFPNQNFVKKYRTEIEFRVLKNYPELIKDISKVLKITATNYLGLLTQLSAMPLSASLINAYIHALIKIGGLDIGYTSYSRFTSTLSIDITKSIASEVPLYDFQEDAVKTLFKQLIEDDKASGMLVMPTGSGKTRTAVYFLLKKMISQGYQVIWLTHRHLLIDQTAQNFYDFAPLAKLESPGINKLELVCVSGHHQTIRATKKDNTVIIMSIQSVCRSLDFLKSVLQKKTIIIVDEAHHTLARSYQNTINRIRKYRKDAKLLGLTATPVRSTDNASKQLLALFENNIIYEISMSNLIVQGILAIPEFTRIDTNEDFEPIISIDEKKFIDKYGELPETLVSKIASSCSRNGLIVSHYVQNRTKYGKTLMFAMNKLHCVMLCEDLHKQGVKCDYIYSGLEDNSEKIRRFKEGELDVLVNINIMTEGSDVPDINTVFLTRPTQSEGLLMQMVGRGMRGKAAGGTEKVNIVDFCDKWDVFNKWLNPEWLMDGDIEEDDPHPREKVIRPYETYSWDLCKDLYSVMTFANIKANTLISLPVCWYALIDEDGNDRRMLVFEDQLSGFVSMMKDKHVWLTKKNVDIEEIQQKYFGGFVTVPTTRDIEMLVTNLRRDDDPPQRFILENRKSIDPVYLAENIRSKRLNPLDVAAKIFAENPMVKNIYGDLNNYSMKVCEHVIFQNGIPPLGIRIEELPEEIIPYRMGPFHDLHELVSEVKNEMFGGSYDGISSISWTDKPYKTYYGKYYYFDNRIKINCVLNSPDVPRETVKYVVYHELLHRDYFRHDTKFRIMEHKYPEYPEHERFFVSQMSIFDIKEW